MSETKSSIFDQSLDVIKQAMENVIQEIVITLEDGTYHIVYLTKFEINGSAISYEFNTPDESRKPDLIPHIEHILKMQIQQHANKKMFAY